MLSKEVSDAKALTRHVWMYDCCLNLISISVSTTTSKVTEMDGDKPLRKISLAFNEIATSITSHHQNPNHHHLDLELASFSHACSLVSPLFRCLGIAFKFAEMDYVAKVLINLRFCFFVKEINILIIFLIVC